MNQTSYREITQTMTFQYKPATVIHLPRILSQEQREKVVTTYKPCSHYAYYYQISPTEEW